eukprot:90662-Alexandrium_andersonii.AAC.1
MSWSPHDRRTTAWNSKLLRPSTCIQTPIGHAVRIRIRRCASGGCAMVGCTLSVPCSQCPAVHCV